MRSFGLLAVLSAVLSAGAGQACCLFKVSAPNGAPAGAATKAAVPVAAAQPPLMIASIGGQAPVSGAIPNPVNANYPIDVVVIANEATGSAYYIQLSVTDLGPTLGAASVTAAAETVYPPKYYRHRTLVATAGGIPPPSSGWEVGFSITCAKGHRFSTYAFADTESGRLKSPPVTFTTLP